MMRFESPTVRTRRQWPRIRRHSRRPRERRLKRLRHPVLRFNPTAWAKLLFLRDQGSTEVGGFGIAPADDLLCVDDVQLLKQGCTAVSVQFDDAAVAEYFDAQVEAGRKPEQFARIWIHTHPGQCASPSPVDERTFRRVFGRCDWAVMFILAEGGETYARIRYGVGPGGEMELPMEVDFGRAFVASDVEAWECEYAYSVQTLDFLMPECSVHEHRSTDVPMADDHSVEEFCFESCPLERSPLESSEPI